MSHVSLQIDAPALLEESGTAYSSADRIKWDKALTVRCPAVRTASGDVLPLTALRRLGFVITRVEPSGTELIWDKKTERWIGFDATLLAGPGVELFALEPVDATDLELGWQGLTILADRERYERGGPARYGARCYFEGALDGHPVFGWSASSGAHELESSSSLKSGFAIEETDSPNFALAFAGAPPSAEIWIDRRAGNPRVKILARSGGSVRAVVSVWENGLIELQSHPGDATRQAAISLPGDGSVVLRPAAGREVFVDGDLRVSGTVTP